jgi:hypothetical protein
MNIYEASYVLALNCSNLSLPLVAFHALIEVTTM